MTNVIVFFSDDRSARGLAGAAAKLGGDTRAIRIDGYQIEETLAALAEACRGAEVVLLANDAYSQELAPRLAHRLGGACAGDGSGVQRVDGRIRVTRQVYGGKAEAVLELKRSPAVVWLRARSFDAGVLPDTVEVLASHDSAASSGTRIVERHVSETATTKLEDANVIVAGGRGIGGPEGFREELQPLAELLGAQLAASRAACDAGWVPPTWQVGQTGKKVAPQLYLAIAITGASQHMAGISEAKTIAAINIDPDAPIFRHARFGVVDDYRKVVPLLRQKLAKP
ncbi:MAG TPA: electron transfer flavoprotein subunit alpha/FixB family protein [Thermoanaerobaculia bacterium]|nr:electron transfer flavoprotein subunit alpha/FixB family protein [Thermoanaerobaculia bacterium]